MSTPKKDDVVRVHGTEATILGTRTTGEGTPAKPLYRVRLHSGAIKEVHRDDIKQ